MLCLSDMLVVCRLFKVSSRCFFTVQLTLAGIYNSEGSDKMDFHLNFFYSWIFDVLVPGEFNIATSSCKLL